MNADCLLQHFNRISEAPDAIPRLRRFILDLAVRGKLVEQDPNDEPASELLKRIQAEKARLAKAGEIRKEKPLPLVEHDEAPFGAPAGWEWVRMRQVTSDRGQTTPDKDFTYIDVTAINKEVGCVADAKVLSPHDAPSRARKLVRTGDVLYSCVRPYLLNIAVIESDIVPAPIASTAFAVLNGFGLVLSKYLWIALRSPFMVECVEAKMRGQAYPAINDSDFAVLPLPLPPLAEQHRIVAKVGELMALCDELEAAQAKHETRRDRLVAATLHGLNSGDARPEHGTRPTFEENARFYFNHLPRLTTRPEHIQQLRQTLLNLAVRGKLVEQNPADEPIDLLIARIQAERKRRANEGQTVSAQTSVDSENGRLPIPQSWGWSRLGFVTNVVMGQSPPGETYNTRGDGIPLINGPVEFSEGAFGVTVLNQYTTAPTKRCKKGDLLLCVRGSTTGRTNVAGFDACIGRGVAALQSLYSDQFIRLFVWSWRDHIIEMGRGIAFPSISRQQIEDLPTPLPPLAEQHRIVAKVGELMALCDELEARLTSTTTARRQLLEATLHEALGGGHQLPCPSATKFD